MASRRQRDRRHARRVYHSEKSRGERANRYVVETVERDVEAALDAQRRRKKKGVFQVELTSFGYASEHVEKLELKNGSKFRPSEDIAADLLREMGIEQRDRTHV